VWVLRHAKAAQGGGDDHERILTARGVRQADELRRYLATGQSPRPLPTTVLCSSARRAVQTAESVVGDLAPAPELLVERALYHADADDVLDRLRVLPDDTGAVMVVGHNPTLHDVAVLLLDPADEAGVARLDSGFPTAALAVVTVPARTWSRLAPGTATLDELWTPAR
jgi:phosphohistidine phosphatase